MCIRPPQRRHLCPRTRGDSRRRSRLLKKRFRGHWLTEGRSELRSQPVEAQALVPPRRYVRGCADLPAKEHCVSGGGEQ